MGRPLVDLTGQVFGKLTVLQQAIEGESGKRWVCQCGCGQMVIAYGSNLKTNRIRSCGCIRVRHGMSGTKLHHVWRTMLDRCNNPNATQYADYGGRGIKVCDRWKEFSNFFADMGHPPQGGTLDRINNDGSYCKENCKWSTRRDQARNKRTNKVITAFGETKTVTDWALEKGINPRTLFNRLLRAKMNPEAALTAGMYDQQRQKRT